MKNLTADQSQGMREQMLRPLFFLLGIVCFGIALLGFMLPMLPGIVFLVLSAACFARSSKRVHDWLVNSKLFGPMIRDWQHHRAISKRNKIIAIVGTIIFGGYSIYHVIDQQWLQWVAVFFMTTGIAIIASLKSRAETVG